MLDTKEKKVWFLILGFWASYIAFIASFGSPGIPLLIILGFTFVYGIAVYSQRNTIPNYIPPARKEEERNWKDEYMELKGWENMSEPEREITSSVAPRRGMKLKEIAMKEELEKMKKFARIKEAYRKKKNGQKLDAEEYELLHAYLKRLLELRDRKRNN
ncbi:hypothetical protein [Synechococcus sp. MIT S9503]|uniref:hypothetical protein n=1 Tax=Synechococcus sp. MIT S9503 TaxID=3082547 RepID=UPI0039A5AF58